MKKKILCLLMAGIMGTGMAVNVQAEAFTGKDAWKVDFNGEEVESNFTSQEMADEVYGILPGDTMELHLYVENSSDLTTDWYMSSEIVKSLEDGSSAQGGAYGYRLWYTDPEGEETLLFDSETIGGEDGENALKEATDSLEDFLYLDTLGKGEQGDVYLRIALDGETQGNDYQNTLARLQMNFAVEETAPDTIQGEDQVLRRTEREPDKKIYQTRQVKTGDPNQLLLVSAVTLASGLVLLFLGLLALKKRRNDRKGEHRS